MKKSRILLILVLLFVAAFVYYIVSNLKAAKKPEPPISAPAVLKVTIPAVAEYVHDTLSYTEGLEFYKGMLYESGGEYGKSILSVYDYKTGKGKKQPVDASIFGEGITILNDKLYMLTWKEKKMLIFDPATLQQTGTMPWVLGEGWGMTNDGKSLIANTGGSTIFFLDPNTLQQQRSISVTDEYGPISNINEMEYVNGFIYANVFTTDNILKIDPQTGKVLARADMSNLYPQYNHYSAESEGGDRNKVMNGIAYNPGTKTFFLTGKNWPKMFEVKID